MYKSNVEELKIKAGTIIKLHRLRKGMSQFQLAIEVGLSKDYIGLIERGKCNPTIEIFAKICNFLDMDIIELFIKRNDVEFIVVHDEVKKLEKEFKNQNKRKS